MYTLWPLLLPLKKPSTQSMTKYPNTRNFVPVQHVQQEAKSIMRTRLIAARLLAKMATLYFAPPFFADAIWVATSARASAMAIKLA